MILQPCNPRISANDKTKEAVIKNILMQMDTESIVKEVTAEIFSKAGKLSQEGRPENEGEMLFVFK